LFLLGVEKNERLNYENGLLLSKLIDISNGKYLSTDIANFQNEKQHKKLAGSGSRKHLNSSKCLAPSASKASSAFMTLPASTDHHRSLNIVVRKQENKKIEDENRQIAKKLFENRSVI
jgi:hypothetical protein